jgi:hypothetical protein
MQLLGIWLECGSKPPSSIKRLWLLDVVAPFQAEIPAAHVVSMVLAADILFVSLRSRSMAEVDPKTAG